MDRIDVGAPGNGRRDRFFARSAGTAFQGRSVAGGTTELELYDEIGYWGVTAKDFRARLVEASGDIVLKINSPGGDVFDGIAIYNELLAYDGKVRVEVTGLAASAASVVAMAGDEIAIGENAFLMIHNAWVVAVGNRHDLTDVADVLAKIDGALAKTYASRSGMGVRTAAQFMDDETWFTAAEAKAKGLATEILQPVEAKARFDLSVFDHAPPVLKAAIGAEAEPETTRDAERMLMQDAGYSRSRARAVIRAFKSADDAMPGAGEVDLSQLAAAVKAATTGL